MLQFASRKPTVVRTVEWSTALRRQRGPLVLVVESDVAARRSLACALQQRGYRVALARSISEAREMLDDLRFIESDVNGLLVDYFLSDGLGCRVVQDFQRDFPGVPAALVIGDDDIAMELWTRARGISLLNKSALQVQLEPWLERVNAHLEDAADQLQISA